MRMGTPCLDRLYEQRLPKEGREPDRSSRDLSIRCTILLMGPEKSL